MASGWPCTATITILVAVDPDKVADPCPLTRCMNTQNLTVQLIFLQATGPACMARMGCCKALRYPVCHEQVDISTLHAIDSFSTACAGSFSFPAVPPDAKLTYEMELIDFEAVNEVC